MDMKIMMTHTGAVLQADADGVFHADAVLQADAVLTLLPSSGACWS